MFSVVCCRNGSSSAVFGSGIKSMSDSWISWYPRIDEPSKPRPSANTSSVSSCAGTEKCCIKPGRSQNRTSTISTSRSLTNFKTSLAVRCSMGRPFFDTNTNVASPRPRLPRRGSPLIPQSLRVVNTDRRSGASREHTSRGEPSGSSSASRHNGVTLRLTALTRDRPSAPN